MNKDIRWKQRFSNFKKAIEQLKEFIEKTELNKFEIQGLIQCFEYTFELSWKTMKDYLEEAGFTITSPRETIQTAFQAQLITNGHIWIDALEKRKLMTHTYDEKKSEQAKQLIYDKYFKMLYELFEKLDKEI